MSRQKLGAYIRNIDYLAVKEDSEYPDDEETPGNKLVDFESLLRNDEDFKFEELKDGFAAFREKVCISKFPGRHSPPYWVAYSTASVLDRLASDFEDDQDKQRDLGHELFYTWLALLCAKPSSGHLDIMDKFTGDLFEKYIEGCKADELVKIMTRMKITFSYDAKNETDEEHTYGSFLNDKTKIFFEYLTEDQCSNPAVIEAFFDLRMFYQQQISKLSPEMADYVGYLVRDMADKFPEETFTDVKAIKSHLSIIEETLCTFEGDLKTLRDEESLEGIIKAARKNSQVKELFPTLMELLTKFSKRKTPLKNGHRIYDVYRIDLFRDIADSVQPDSDMFDDCVTMIKSILTDGSEADKAKQVMIDEAISDCLLKVNSLSPPQVKILLDLLLTMVKTGRIKMIHIVNGTLRTKEFTKLLVWKNLIAEAKQFLDVIGTLNETQLEEDERGNKEFDDVLRKLRDTVETLLELFRKGKILKEVLKDHVTFMMNCLECTSPNKCELAYKASDDKYLILSAKDKDIVDLILDKVDKMLKQPDVDWDIDRSVTVQCLISAVIQSYNKSGKNVSDSQNATFMSIFATCCEGENIEDRLVDPNDEENWTVYLRIYTAAGINYLALHSQSKTLVRCLPLIKNILKWARIATQEEHNDLKTASFGCLVTIGSALSPEIAVITPEVVDLFLSVENSSDLISLMIGLYALKPEPVHSKLQQFVDKMDDMSHTERVSVAALLGQVAGKRAQAFTEDQVGKLIEFAIEDAQSQPMYFHIFNHIANQCPETMHTFFTKLRDDAAYNSSILIFRVMIVVRIACYDKKLTGEAAEFALKHMKLSDPTTTQQIVSQVFLLVRNDREGMIKYRDRFESLEQKAANMPELKDYFRNIVNAIDGKSVEGVFEEMQQVQEDIFDLDNKMNATMNTVVNLGEHVIEQGKDIDKVRSDVDNLDERVDDVEEDLGETKVKVEEIDNKTMTNAPKWSRDLTKLLNPKDEYDWRLLAQRLGYSNDDIRAWAQQHDPCMALLSEWYATNKTSEANFAILTHLQEMNRLDGAIIVENAMKASEDIVEDEEFEYPSPPPIFLSYQWGVQEEVKLLKQHLNMAGYECWMDIGQMGGGDKLFNKIDSGIRAAKVIISCTTEKYAQSPNCNREVNLSVNLNKPIIPLLMEKMSWPPKGSMGPIFSEYLFIRFFQRAGEETKDQRYWPVAKFQELLMQMNFYTVPDPKLITPVYNNWWNPTIEDIKIDKKKKASETKSSTNIKATTQNEPSSDVSPSPLIFLSYQWGKQPQVKALYERLVSFGYTVWMDIYQMGGGDSLYDKIDRGLRGCKVVVSCITPKYALSANCRREVSLADALKRPIIPLLFESMTWPPDGPMSMVFTELLFINVNRDPEIQTKWTGPKIEELSVKLKMYIPEEKDTGSKEAGSKANPTGQDDKDQKSKENVESNTNKNKQSENSGSSKSEAPTGSEKANDHETTTSKSRATVVQSKTVNKQEEHKKTEPQKSTSKSCVLL